MDSGFTVPEVSLISSWYVPLGNAPTRGSGLPALTLALQDGIGLLDLYFLHHSDIPWYARAAGRKRQRNRGPQGFVASLQVNELERIADRLREELTKHYGGRLVGRRPRLAALATYFPNASLPPTDRANQDSRNEAVAALRNTLYLARLLGCRCVEIVGGCGVPNSGYKRKADPPAYRQQCLQALAQTLADVYNLEDGAPLEPISEDDVPVVSIELEPGPSFLMNSLDAFRELRDTLDKEHGPDSLVYKSLKLNVDIAHAFLIGYTPTNLTEEKLQHLVAHMHISDHAGDIAAGGAHASDVVPGTFHAFRDDLSEHAYAPWLKLAIERANAHDGSFCTGTIAVELEACNNVLDVLSSVSLVRRWVWRQCQEMAGEKQTAAPGGATTLEGALLVVDVGNSTKELLRGKTDAAAAALLQRTMQGLCTLVHDKGGSVMSFTGDGFIALFETAHYLKDQDAAQHVLNVLDGLKRIITRIRKTKDITFRAALHWGHAYVPTAGPLRGEVIGRDVVLVTRLCEEIERIHEKARPPKKRGMLTIATESFYEKLGKDEIGIRPWYLWGEDSFKDFEHRAINLYRRERPA